MLLGSGRSGCGGGAGSLDGETVQIEASLGRRLRAAWRLGDYGQGASAAVLAEAWAGWG